MRGLPERARARRVQQRAPRALSRRRRSAQRPSTRWRPPTPPAGVTRSQPGCTRATSRCGTISSGAATRSTRSPARWGWRSTTSAPPARARARPLDWPEYLRIVGVPPDFSAAWTRRVPHPGRRLDGETVATALAFDLDGDCGIYNVGTLEHARRRGLGTALTALLLHDARARGCDTASLQATKIAEGVYTAVGFRDLGRIFEYVPPPARTRGA